MKMVPHLQEAALLIRHHHERFEGKGFPDRLFGRKIPLGSRIIAAVNAYDNALNSRIIRYDVPEKAYLYVQQCTPRDFDPKVVSMLGMVLHEQEREPVDKDPDAKLKIEDLYPGMVLSKDLFNAQGILVLPKGTTIDEKQLDQLMKHQQDY